MSITKTLEGTVKTNVSKTVVRKKLRQAATVEPNFHMQKGFLYTVVRAISARVNQNYDGWPSEELKKSYLSFVGKPVFVNHQNFDPEKARGRVVAARYVDAGADKYVEVIQEIDAQRFPRLAKEIISGGLDSVSMGAEAGFTICSYCGNRATDVPEMCDHVLHSKGKELYSAKLGKKQLVYEECRDLGFFELSYVFDPADETAVVSKVIQASRRPTGNERKAITMSDMALKVAEHAVFHDQRGAGPTHNRMDSELLDDPYKRQGMDPEDEFNLRTQQADEYSAPEAPPQPPELALPGPDVEADYQKRTKAADDYAYRDLHEKHADRQTPNVGSPQVPNSVDTLRGQDQEDGGAEEDSTNDFKHWVEAPQDFQDPDISLTQRLDQEQEKDGLDGDRNVEDVENYEGADHAQNDQAAQQQQGGNPNGQADLRSLMGSRSDDVSYLMAMRRVAQGDGEVTNHDPGGDVWGGGYGGTHMGDGPEALGLTMMPGITNRGEGADVGLPGSGVKAPSNEGLAHGSEGMGEAMTPSTTSVSTEAPNSALNLQKQISGTPAMPNPTPTMASRQLNDIEYLTAMRRMASETPAPVNDGRSSMNERRTRRGTTMARRETLASRGQNATPRLRHHADGPLVDGGDQSENDQGEQEEVYISQTPDAESVELGDDLSGIPNNQNNLVARINANAAQLRKDQARYQALQASRRHADDGVSEVATTVNPPLPTGHDELRGDDFQSANPNAGVNETQPSDSHRASVQAFRSFDSWLAQGTGKTARQHGNETYVLRQASRFAAACGQHPAGMFPTLGNVLRQIRSDEGQRRANMGQRRADVAPSSYDLAAPGGRTDVEKPVSNTTDADAQASQFGDEEFGHNAGDGVADPVLTTGPSEETGNAGIWAPGDASKTSRVRAASASEAVRCADLFVMAGLSPAEQRYNLIDLHQRMSSAQVRDRIAMATGFINVRKADHANAVKQARLAVQKVASGSSRGTGVTALPPGFGSGRVASMGHQAATNINDPAFDSVTWI